MSESISLDHMNVRRLLPHRYPFLLVDRVLECVKGESIRAIKNVTANEPFFPGHFPHRPVMPGVMIIEALAQTAGLLAFVTADVVPDDSTRFFFVVCLPDKKSHFGGVPGLNLNHHLHGGARIKTGTHVAD